MDSASVTKLMAFIALAAYDFERQSLHPLTVQNTGCIRNQQMVQMRYFEITHWQVHKSAPQIFHLVQESF
jgi:hypothetical protein